MQGVSRELRRFTRALILAVHVLWGAVLAVWLALLPRRWRARATPKLTGRWLRRAARILHVKVITHGLAHPVPCLTVANHISWLDVLVIATQHDASFVAKAEVSEWPVLGWLARCGGTEFIRRGDHTGYRRILDILTERFARGEPLVLFPEGTSHASFLPARFRPRLIQAAVKADVPVQPLALYYGSDELALQRVAYTDDDNFVTHLWRLLGFEYIVAEMAFLPALHTTDRDCKQLAADSHRVIVRTLLHLALFESETRDAVQGAAGVPAAGHDAYGIV